jgi:Leucine-rich repeat (LRR) protein
VLANQPALGPELVLHRLSLHVVCRVHEMDVSNLRMRDIGSVFSPITFPNLTELDLSTNMLTSLAGLKHLPALRVLKAPHNRLGLCTGSLFDAESASCTTNGNTFLQASSEPPAARTDAILANLQVLILADNRMSRLDALPLAQLTSLRSLFLQNNVIQRLDGIASLIHLEELVCPKLLVTSTLLCVFKCLWKLLSVTVQTLCPGLAKMAVVTYYCWWKHILEIVHKGPLRTKMSHLIIAFFIANHEMGSRRSTDDVRGI